MSDNVPVYVWIIRNEQGQPIEARILPAEWVWPIAGKVKLIDCYEVRKPTGERFLVARNDMAKTNP